MKMEMKEIMEFHTFQRLRRETKSCVVRRDADEDRKISKKC